MARAVSLAAALASATWSVRTTSSRRRAASSARASAVAFAVVSFSTFGHTHTPIVDQSDEGRGYKPTGRTDRGPIR
eukprot:9466892-Pyramimonas_sp.AAC.1